MTKLRRPTRSKAAVFRTRLGLWALAGASEAAERLGGGATAEHGLDEEGEPVVGVRIPDVGLATIGLREPYPRTRLLHKVKKLMAIR